MSWGQAPIGINIQSFPSWGGRELESWAGISKTGSKWAFLEGPAGTALITALTAGVETTARVFSKSKTSLFSGKISDP